MTMTNLIDIVWAVDEPTLVTPLGPSRALVVRLGHAAEQGGPPTAFVLHHGKAFNSSHWLEDVLTINDEVIDLGERTVDFLNILEEAGAIGIRGVAYLSDPFAA